MEAAQLCPQSWAKTPATGTFGQIVEGFNPQILKEACHAENDSVFPVNVSLELASLA